MKASYRESPQKQSDQPEQTITPSQQKAAQKAIEAGRQMEQAVKEGDAKKAAEKAEEVIEACDEYLKDALKQENVTARRGKTK